jgi:hypothetical protein
MREDGAKHRATESVKALYAAGDITIIGPSGAGAQLIKHKGGTGMRLDRPVSGVLLVRLDATTHIGRIHLRHPGAPPRRPRAEWGRR